MYILSDDNIVTGKINQEHLAKIEKLFKIFAEYGIQINKAKCKFLQNEVKFLGHIICIEGIKKTYEKVNIIF